MRALAFLYLLAFTMSASSFAGDITDCEEETKPACDDSRLTYKTCTDQMKLFKEAKAKALAERKTLLLVIGAEWCPACQELSKVLKNSRFAELGKNFLYQPIALKKQFSNFPSGEEVLKALSLKPADAWKFPFVYIVDPATGSRRAVSTKDMRADKVIMLNERHAVKPFSPERTAAVLIKARADLLEKGSKDEPSADYEE